MKYFFAALIITTVAVSLYFVLSYFRRQRTHKFQTVLDASYPMRESYASASGFGDYIKYEFFINDEWIDLEEAYKYLESENFK